ncbi:uncharacterized protein L201_003592 [Kwoniella dendrophila CBS 6074]|uniref:Carbohydrate kinase PfkB domain-containing protein n=1 Tax=Kwoniella dendrophila CBS 6074 TaxID=1295534 RepID=A0AAX4JTM1_9TREE
MSQDEDDKSVSNRVVTLEQFIVDTFTRVGNDGIERPVDQPDQIGGGGTYAIIGGRMFVPPSKLGMIIDYTPDTLPTNMRNALKEFGEEMWVFRERTDGHPTARAVNKYDEQARHFQYLTKPLLLTPNSLLGTTIGNPLPSTIHFISYPAPRAEIILSEVFQLKQRRAWNPIIIWEPEEENLVVLERIARNIHVIGPNHNEILRLFPMTIPPSSSESELREIYSQACNRIALLRPKIGVVIRCGHLGCCYSSTPPLDMKPEVKWIPAYWNPQRTGWKQGKVVDPTGAGNAFMGGLAAALNMNLSLDEAVIWGSVAASFTIEQDGLPVLTKNADKELWNGEDPLKRVKIMKKTREDI